jgi:hypothetical protein
MTDSDAVVGRSDYPLGLDPRLPLRHILWWQNREMIHHAANTCQLRMTPSIPAAGTRRAGG